MRRVFLLTSIAGGVLLGGALWAMRPGLDARTPATIQVADRANQEKVELNHASRDELLRIPGMSVELADRVLQSRPYRKLDDLVSRKVLGKKEFARIRDHIAVRRAP